MSSELQDIATRTRTLLENISKELLINAQPNLAGLCGYGSIMLSEELQRNGHKAQIIGGYGHWFVQCDEKYLMDITASQFGQANVIVKDFEEVQKEVKACPGRTDYWKFCNVDSIERSPYLAQYKKQIDAALKKKVWAHAPPERPIDSNVIATSDNPLKVPEGTQPVVISNNTGGYAYTVGDASVVVVYGTPPENSAIHIPIPIKKDL